MDFQHDCIYTVIKRANTFLGINDSQTKAAIFNASHEHFRNKDYNGAVMVFSEALKTFPNDEGFMSELAMALALNGGTDKLIQAVTLCKRILSGNAGEKVHHTTRAALCFIYLKAGQKEKAMFMARSLPHVRESREVITKQLESELSMEDIDANLDFIAIGESDQQDIITVDFGMNMIPICTDFDLTGKIAALREEIDAPHTNEGLRKLPLIRVRDNVSLAPNQIRVRYYADVLIDKEFVDCGEVIEDIIAAIRKTICTQ